MTSKKRIGAVIQARMTSRRFPGKVLYEVSEKPLLGYLIDSLLRCETSFYQTIVATSTDISDDPVVEFCQKAKISYFRGPLQDVAGRFLSICKAYKLDAFVRISGDSPLLDYRIVDRAVQIFHQDQYDLVTNVLKRTFPKGQSVEIVDSQQFERAYCMMQSEDERENVTRYYYTQPERFRIHNFESNGNYGHIQLSVDTPDDMDRFKAIIQKLEHLHWKYTYEDLTLILDEINPLSRKSAC